MGCWVSWPNCLFILDNNNQGEDLISQNNSSSYREDLAVKAQKVSLVTLWVLKSLKIFAFISWEARFWRRVPLRNLLDGYESIHLMYSSWGFPKTCNQTRTPYPLQGSLLSLLTTHTLSLPLSIMHMFLHSNPNTYDQIEGLPSPWLLLLSLWLRTRVMRRATKHDPAAFPVAPLEAPKGMRRRRVTTPNELRINKHNCWCGRPKGLLHAKWYRGPPPPHILLSYHTLRTVSKESKRSRRNNWNLFNIICRWQTNHQLNRNGSSCSSSACRGLWHCPHPIYSADPSIIIRWWYPEWLLSLLGRNGLYQ